MKKVYLLALAAGVFTLTANAQFDDDIESYPIGTINNDIWQSWDGTAGTADDISVSDDEALSGSQSILVAEGGVIDGILNLGNKTEGVWELTFNMFVPSGKSGYFNIQNTLPAGTLWNYHCTLNEGGSDEGTIVFYDATGENQGPGTPLGVSEYAVDDWTKFTMIIDLDNLTLDLLVDDNEVISGTPYTGDSLGGINFYSNEGGGEDNRYYVDDASFQEASLGAEDFSSDVFSVYPNPVKTDLHIRSASPVEFVTVFDVLGKAVLNVQPDAVSPTIDMSTLSSGAYLVKVTIDGTSKTVKVIK